MREMNNAASRRLGRALRESGSDGVVYDSVRDPGGQCAGVFWPDCVAPFSQAAHYTYVWDGTRVTDVIELTGIRL